MHEIVDWLRLKFSSKTSKWEYLVANSKNCKFRYKNEEFSLINRTHRLIIIRQGINKSFSIIVIVFNYLSRPLADTCVQSQRERAIFVCQQQPHFDAVALCRDFIYKIHFLHVSTMHIIINIKTHRFLFWGYLDSHMYSSQHLLTKNVC